MRRDGTAVRDLVELGAVVARQNVGKLVVFAARAGAARGAGEAELEALAVVLLAVRLLAVAAARGCQAVGVVRRRRGEVHLRLNQVEQLFALLVGVPILAAHAAALVAAKHARAQAVAVQLEAARLLAVARLVGGRVRDPERRRRGLDKRQLRAYLADFGRGRLSRGHTDKQS